jgi:hypothetical protein
MDEIRLGAETVKLSLAEKAMGLADKMGYGTQARTLMDSWDDIKKGTGLMMAGALVGAPNIPLSAGVGAVIGFFGLTAAEFLGSAVFNREPKAPGFGLMVVNAVVGAAIGSCF